MEKVRNNTHLLSMGILAIYLLIFFTIDYLNMPYTVMAKEEGIVVVSLHILLNLVMAGLSTYLFQLHESVFSQIGKAIKGSYTPVYASIFGLLTYGCTPCVISFFAAIGINFTIVALPWAGLPYKLISLLILLIGIWFSHQQMKKACSI